jgi:hypothetical protein
MCGICWSRDLADSGDGDAGHREHSAGMGIDGFLVWIGMNVQQYNGALRSAFNHPLNCRMSFSGYMR